jgi:hypothetical protein
MNHESVRSIPVPAQVGVHTLSFFTSTAEYTVPGNSQVRALVSARRLKWLTLRSKSIKQR